MTATPTTLLADVRAGLSAEQKSLPPYLFYDQAGSALYEEITRLPEYYLWRIERDILEEHAAEIVAEASRGQRGLSVVELGAGSATNTELLLRAVLARHGRCAYVPIDVSKSATDEARARLARDVPRVEVTPLVMSHAEGLSSLVPDGGAPSLVLFIGSSVGNFEDGEAAAMLGRIRPALGDGFMLLLGTDLRKAKDVMLRAYDDAAGVTAAFNKNMLVRLNREAGADFDVARFRHAARWNEKESRIEMHLVSAGRQTVTVDALGTKFAFAAGETIHTESSIKYDLPRVERLLGAAGLALKKTYFDREKLFAVHLAAPR